MRPLLGIDLGTANTLACTQKGIVWEQPTVVAMQRDQQVVALGDAAKTMIGRTPSGVQTIRPVQSGVVADMAASGVLLRHLVRLVSRRLWLKPHVVLATDPYASEAARHALVEVAYASGARQVLLMDSPIAAALGSDLPVDKAHGLLLVDIGGGTADASVLSLGNVVVSATSQVAGNAMDQALIQYLRKAYDLIIGEATAERLKIEIGSATAPLEQKAVVSGRCMRTGLPRQISIHASEVHEALYPGLQDIAQTILSVLAQTPPELVADIGDEGFWLTGGGSLMRGLASYLTKETGMPVQTVADPLRAVALGTCQVMKYKTKFGLKTIHR